MKLIRELQSICEADEPMISDRDEWMDAVRKAYPDRADKIKFKGRVEGGKHIFFAEIPGEDRCYGVYDMDDEEGQVLHEGKKRKKKKIPVAIAFGYGGVSQNDSETDLSEGAVENTYYVVDEPITVYVHDKYEKTGEYVHGPAGAAALNRMTYKTLELDDGDEIHHLVGGLFFVQIGRETKVYEGVIVKPAEKSAFEKNYGYTDPQIAAIKKLETDNKISKIPKSETTSVKYR